MRIYLKYRPQKFSEVKGQNHIVSVLSKAVEIDKVPNSMLFCGTRGTGKTSVARILAKAVNCTNRVGSEPCGTCLSCMATDAKAHISVREIDAASYRGIDDVRKIAEMVKFEPAENKKFVWIIDECHQLTTDACNAFLKILEEAPPWIVFILCTTESEKVIETVRSRCMRFDFSYVKMDVLTTTLTNILDKECVKYDSAAIQMIVTQAAGSIRDALTIVEPLVIEGGIITVDEVIRMCGSLSPQDVVDLFDSIITCDTKSVCIRIRRLLDLSNDPKLVMTTIGGYIHDLALVLHSCSELVLKPETVIAKIQVQVDMLKFNGVHLIFDYYWEHLNRIVSELDVEMFPIFLTHRLKWYLNWTLTDEFLEKFLGSDSRFSIEAKSDYGAVLKIGNKMIDLVRFPNESVHRYYITIEDARLAGNIKNIKNIKVKESV